MTAIYPYDGQCPEDMTCSPVSATYLNPEINYEEMLDPRDGQVYKIVKIGNQVWMAQNLNYDYNVKTAKSYCYNNSSNNCAIYGRLYQWSAAMDSAAVFTSNGKGCGVVGKCNASGNVRGACPKGWHLPDLSEVSTLLSFVAEKEGIDYEISSSGNYSIVGLDSFLKSTQLWKTTKGNGIDKYGFCALPAGDYSKALNFGSLNQWTYFWISSFHNNIETYEFSMTAMITNNPSVYVSAVPNDVAYSVRCLKD